MRVATVHQIQALVRGRRKDLQETQESVARRAQVSRKWLSEFERGVTTAAELPLVLRILAALDLDIDIDPTASHRSAPTRTEPAEVDLDEVLRRYAGRGEGQG